MNRTFTLRLDSFEKYEENDSNVSLTVKLYEDLVFSNYTYDNPVLNENDYGLYLGAKNVKEYGLIPLDGFIQAFHTPSDIKKRLEITNSITNGVIVSQIEPFSKENKISISFLIRKNIYEFFKGYYAFLYDLTLPGEKIFTINGTENKFYYTSSNVHSSIIQNNKMYCHFTINITLL